MKKVIFSFSGGINYKSLLIQTRVIFLIFIPKLIDSYTNLLKLKEFWKFDKKIKLPLVLSKCLNIKNVDLRISWNQNNFNKAQNFKDIY